MKPCKRCRKPISDKIKSGLCRACYIYEMQKKYREGRVKKGLCASCGKKVKVERCPHCKKIIKRFYRCKDCLKKVQRKRDKK